ncbi:MAG: hypothetical protein EP335_09485 [Alphaproteobacteria bacterium]|nr:MAG: hypothetical protein EP335_09485 [Alphaproteobacteria bacterium]
MDLCIVAGFPNQSDLVLLGGFLAYGLYFLVKARSAPYLPVATKNIYSPKWHEKLQRLALLLVNCMMYVPLIALATAFLFYRLKCLVAGSSALPIFTCAALAVVMTVALAVRYPVHRMPGTKQ